MQLASTEAYSRRPLEREVADGVLADKAQQAASRTAALAAAEAVRADREARAAQITLVQSAEDVEACILGPSEFGYQTAGTARLDAQIAKLQLAYPAPDPACPEEAEVRIGFERSFLAEWKSMKVTDKGNMLRAMFEDRPDNRHPPFLCPPLDRYTQPGVPTAETLEAHRAYLEKQAQRQQKQPKPRKKSGRRRQRQRDDAEDGSDEEATSDDGDGADDEHPATHQHAPEPPRRSRRERERPGYLKDMFTASHMIFDDDGDSDSGDEEASSVLLRDAATEAFGLDSAALDAVHGCVQRLQRGEQQCDAANQGPSHAQPAAPTGRKRGRANHSNGAVRGHAAVSLHGAEGDTPSDPAPSEPARSRRRGR